MSGEIERINTYDDKRFPKEVLRQHGAFIVDGKHKCYFTIINEDSAEVYYDKEINIDEIIDEFRFYSEHIVKFYNNGELIKEFPPIKIFNIGIDSIQPSQFYVDVDKVNSISSFINCEEDIVIPLTKMGEEFISLDGHTRLYYGVTKGYKKVRGFITEPGDYIEGFVEEAKKRGVNTPRNLIPVSHEEYKIKWNKFCEDFFKDRE